MSIIVFLEQSGGEIAKASLAALNAAKQIGTAWKDAELIGLTLGNDGEAAAKAASEYGFSKVYFSESEVLKEYTAVSYAKALETLIEQVGASCWVAAATTTGKDLLPRVNAKFDAGQASDILEVCEDGTLKRPMYAGDVIATVELLTEKRAVTVRASSFDPAEKRGAVGALEELKWDSSDLPETQVVRFETSGGERPDLGDAEVVVSGGRAMGSKENFEQVLFPLADALNAAVGASRAAVDSGYAPNDWQVGQTGKIVAPGLYIALGISGAIQHLAGMKDSKVIVAINKDPDAPIFEVADYGLVADLFEAVPELVEALNSRG